jgi:prepilin-type N-terminal cleavage/methylation domain-containing protein/prepilin-type processing-associated H-X9-DG protein
MRRRGFTLIELLVVIAIIGILAAMLFPVFARARESARKIQCLSNVKNIAMAAQMYFTDYDRFPPDETRSEVLAYFYSVDGVDGPGGCGVCNDHQDCNDVGHPMDANPFLRGPVILDEYIKNRDVWRCPSAKTDKGACFIVPDYHPGGWFQYMVDNEGKWGRVAGNVGPCMLDWPPGWGGHVTDSIAQDARLAEWDGPGSGCFFYDIDVNFSKATAGKSMNIMNDPAKYVMCSDAGFHSPLPITTLRLAFPDVNSPENYMCGGGGDWDNCSWSRDCSVGHDDYAKAFATEPDYRRKFARHLGGSNVGFADGHAKWYSSESIVAQGPRYNRGGWCGPIVYRGLEGIDTGGPTQAADGGEISCFCCCIPPFT